MSFAGGPGTVLLRGPGRGPIWTVPTPRGPAALTLDQNGLLDRDDVLLEDIYFPEAAEHVPLVVAFLRGHSHEALPRHVDDWIARDRTIHQYSAKSGYDGPIHHMLCERGAGVSGFRYLQSHRSRGAGLPPALALRIVERLADACRLAHAAGVVHAGIMLDHCVRVAANGRPVLEHWTNGRRGLGNVGCDREGLWYGVRDLLGGDVPCLLPVGDVFALGSMLALLVTGEPAYVRGPRRHEYRPPSARGPGFAWLDEVVGLACDPAQGLGLTASALAGRLVGLLAERRPTPQQVLSGLERGAFAGLAQAVACASEPAVGALASAVCDAVRRHVIGALARERAVPMFSELLLAVCPEARALVRAYAGAPRGSSWGRHRAIRLLANVHEPDLLELALTARLGEWGAPFGWSLRPELVDTEGAPCHHPWRSLVGEPSFDEREGLRRMCPQCGPVRSARGFWDERIAGAAGLDFSRVLQLMVTTDAGTVVRPLWPGVPGCVGAEASDMLAIAGLDPADHAEIVAVDGFSVVFTYGLFDVSFADGSELRADRLDTREVGASLEVGPLRFEASAPGELSVRVPEGVSIVVTGRAD